MWLKLTLNALATCVVAFSSRLRGRLRLLLGDKGGLQSSLRMNIHQCMLACTDLNGQAHAHSQRYHSPQKANRLPYTRTNSTQHCQNGCSTCSCFRRC